MRKNGFKFIDDIIDKQLNHLTELELIVSYELGVLDYEYKFDNCG